MAALSGKVAIGAGVRWAHWSPWSVWASLNMKPSANEGKVKEGASLSRFIPRTTMRRTGKRHFQRSGRSMIHFEYRRSPFRCWGTRFSDTGDTTLRGSLSKKRNRRKRHLFVSRLYFKRSRTEALKKRVGTSTEGGRPDAGDQECSSFNLRLHLADPCDPQEGPQEGESIG